MRSRRLELGKCTKTITNGIPQGSGLSPVLFNIYTAQLHHTTSDRTTIFQFADDFFILCHDKLFNKAKELLTQELHNMFSKCANLDLTFNMSKVNIIHFCRRPRDLDISINNEQLNQTNRIKYLGIHITASGSARVHVDETMYKVDHTCDFLKILSGCRFGVAPYRALHFYKAFARPKIEYGAAALSNLTKTAETRIKTCIHGWLRKSLGLIRSTPTPIIYQLAAELPPRYRFQISTAKELIKSKAYGLPVIKQVQKLGNINSSYALTLRKFNEIILNVAPTRATAASSKYINIVRDFFKGIATKKSEANIQIVNQLINEKIAQLKEENFEIFFTDGSVIDNISGAAFLHINSNTLKSFYTDKKLASMTAEIIAIHQVLIFAQNNALTKIAILTDSKSGIQAIKSKNHKSYLIDDLVHISNSAQIKVEMHYIPGHLNITQNETVDLAAKNAENEGTFLNIRWPINDAINHIQDKIWEDWSEEYSRIAEHSNSHFFKIFTKPERTPWYKKSKLHPDDQKMMNRILSNHTFSKSTLYKMNAVPSADCETCNAEETISHILFSCTKHDNIRSKYKSFNGIFTVEDFIAKHHWEHLHDMVKFIKETTSQI